MCCFSGNVTWVGKTKVFARGARGGERQWLAYAMSFAARDELAMILPIPTAVGAGEDAVRFIDLSGYPTLFDDLEKTIPRPQSRGAPMPASRSFGAMPKLVVHEVGNLEASFVPTVSDFSRLDARFRLPAATWDKLPTQKTYGFVVVKLGKNANQQNIHPIAFDFPRRDKQRIFFPTLHVHDGEAHTTAAFDHTLYAQLTDKPKHDSFWLGSGAPVSPLVDEKRANGLIDGQSQAWACTLSGNLKNDDVWI